MRKEREEEKKERSGRRLLLRISIARSASLHIPSSRIPDGAKGRGLAGTRRDNRDVMHCQELLNILLLIGQRSQHPVVAKDV